MEQDQELNLELDLSTLEYNLSLELTPNVYGMHKDGKVTIVLPNIQARTHKTTLDKLFKYLWHETMHYAIRLCLTEGEIEWAKQDRIIGLMEKTKRI